MVKENFLFRDPDDSNSSESSQSDEIRFDFGSPYIEKGGLGDLGSSDDD